jgi:hypothetical protein
MSTSNTSGRCASFSASLAEYSVISDFACATNALELVVIFCGIATSRSAMLVVDIDLADDPQPAFAADLP